MKRHIALKANPDTTRAWQRRTQKALPWRSAKRKDEAPTRAAVREAVFERDGHTCRMRALENHDCLGHLTPHHLRREGQGGEYAATNLIALCAAGNDGVDTMAEAHAFGLVQYGSDSPAEVWRRLYEHGLSSSPEVGSAP